MSASLSMVSPRRSAVGLGSKARLALRAALVLTGAAAIAWTVWILLPFRVWTQVGSIADQMIFGETIPPERLPPILAYLDRQPETCANAVAGAATIRLHAARYLKLSYELGPRESWISYYRNGDALLHFESLSPPRRSAFVPSI